MTCPIVQALLFFAYPYFHQKLFTFNTKANGALFNFTLFGYDIRPNNNPRIVYGMFNRNTSMLYINLIKLSF